ncbi:MAG: hypothetical protein QOE61_1030, partial [Micromonosporaceae bacterium]|nr:hypothetical protein [Micromonosporaceae bacterium]
MARDADPDKSSKRRWGRGGRPEEGPSDEEMGWLADLRDARDERAPLEEPTGRGRRGAVPPEEPTGNVRGRRGATPAEEPTGNVPGRRGATPAEEPSGSIRARRPAAPPEESTGPVRG